MPDRAEGSALCPSPVFEAALRLSAVAHQDQTRKSSGVPYVEHPFAVALILDRAGFDEEVVIAGLLHDVVEDTDVTLDQIRDQFEDRVADLVAACSEEKLDPLGQKRPWADRKRDHLAVVAKAPVDARAVVLADKLHNLLSLFADQIDGRSPWDAFHADRVSVLAYYHAMIDACGSDDPRLKRLAGECRDLLGLIEESIAPADS